MTQFVHWLSLKNTVLTANRILTKKEVLFTVVIKRMLFSGKRFITEFAWGPIITLTLYCFYLFFLLTDAPIEKSLPTLFLCGLVHLIDTMKWMRLSITEMRKDLTSMFRNSRDSSTKYCFRLLQYLQASDIIKEAYTDGLLYNPDYLSKDGKLTINLPDGTALIVRDMGYPVTEPGVYINLRDPDDNEYCIIRAEFSKQHGIRLIAYQYGMDEAAFDIQYFSPEEKKKTEG